MAPDVKIQRLTIPQVMYRLRLKSYRRAYELVNSGALGEIQLDGRSRTVSAAAVEAYRAQSAPPAKK